MDSLSSGQLAGPIEAEPPEDCYFLTIPLEIREAIYRLLLTTPYCTHLNPTGKSLEFRFSTNIILANKQVSVEAKRVFLEENDFIILYVSGLDILIRDIPVFNFIDQCKGLKPMLQVHVEYVGRWPQRPMQGVSTFITTPDGLQPIISVLWELRRSNPEFDIDCPCHNPGNNIGCICDNPDIYPSNLKISMKFKVKSLARCEALRNSALRPWDRLHGVRQLILVGDIGDSMHRHLKTFMLKGPFPTELVLNLREYHAKGQTEMIQRNYRAARWSLTLFDRYWKHLGLLWSDASIEHEMKVPANTL